jgi:hypothetical protein
MPIALERMTIERLTPRWCVEQLTDPLQRSMIHGDACFAYFNKIWGIPYRVIAG